MGLQGEIVRSETAEARVVGVVFEIEEAEKQKKIRQPKQKRLPNPLSDAQVRSLLPRLKNPIYRACSTLIYACGLRAGEGTGLEIAAIDGFNRLLRSIGQGDKERIGSLHHPVSG